MIFNGAHFKRQSMLINIGLGDVIGKSREEFCVKMGHTHFNGCKKKANSLEKLTVKGCTLKGSSDDTISEYNVDDHYFKCSCDNASSEKAHSETCDEDFLEVRRASVYHSSKSQRKSSLGTSKEYICERKEDSQSISKKNKGLDGTNLYQRPAMDGRHEQKGGNDFLATKESLDVYLNGMAKYKKVETDDLIRNMSNLPYYLQRTEEGESFQERALRFGVLDWSRLEKWNRNRGGKEHRSFHSSSGSDTSSSFSTLGSSSFSCRSDLSSSAKRERSSSTSLHSYLNSASVSAINLHCLSHSSSPTRGQERHAYTEGSRCGSKEISLNAQLKTDCEDTHYGYLDFKFLQEKAVGNQSSKEEIQKDISAPLVNEVSFSIHKDQGHAHFSGSGMDNDDGIHGSQTEQGSNSGFELPKEQWGLATPGFFSARDRSPETCSEVSLIGSTQVASVEDDVNIQFVDCYDELPATHADGGNSQTAEPALLDKYVASVHNPSSQKVAPYISISPGSESCIFQDSHEGILPKCSVYPVDKNLKNTSGNVFHVRNESNDILFFQSQSVVDNELHLRNKDVDVPVNSAGSFSDQKLPETVTTTEFPIGVSRTHKNRRAKSFSVSRGRDPAINDHETSFMTPKSFSVTPDTCSCHCRLSKDGCKVCKKVSVSPLRRWIDPIVKSRERHQMNVSSCAPLQGNSPDDRDDDGIINSKAGIRTNISLRKTFAQGCSGGIHKTLRNPSVRSTSSDNYTFVASENDILGKHFLHMSRSRCSSPGLKHENVSVKLSQFASETDIALSTMPTPPAHPPILQGLLHFVYKNGLPYFTFSLNESEEVLTAKTLKTDSSEGKDFDWMYSFHSGKSNKKKNKSGWVSWGKKDNHILDIVGNMKVSSSLCSKLNSYGNIEDQVETEFVLFGIEKGSTKEYPTMQTEYTENIPFSPCQLAHAEVSSDMPLSNSFSVSTTSSTSMPGDTMESVIPRNMEAAKHLVRKNEIHVLRYPFRRNFRESRQTGPRRSRSAGRNTSQATWTELDTLDSDMFLSGPFCLHLELAALVIRGPLEWRESVKGGLEEGASSNTFGGWGLKFLAKGSDGSSSESPVDYPMNLPPFELNDDNHCHSLKSSNSRMKFNNMSVVNSFLNAERCSFENGSSESLDTNSSCRAQGHTSMTVIIPAGIHSQPTTKSDGPSSLIERWRSGGRCDCGGWDLGCSLTILENPNSIKNSLSEKNAEGEGFHLSDMFIQGTNQGTPALSLAVVREGLYSLRFHAQLSALQAFSISVAILHSREPFMSLKETKIQESCSRSLHAPIAKQVRTLSQAISTPQDDIPISMPSNHDIFFVSCVPDPPLSPFGRV